MLVVPILVAVDMSKKPRENRVPIMMSDEELTSIDDWRYQNRVATRSDAVRKLTQIGLGTSRNTDHLRYAIAEALHANISAVHLLEEKFVTRMEGPDDLVQLYSRIVGSAVDALAILDHASKNHFESISPFSATANTMEDALEDLGYRSEEIEDRRAALERLREMRKASQARDASKPST